MNHERIIQHVVVVERNIEPIDRPYPVASYMVEQEHFGYMEVEQEHFGNSPLAGLLPFPSAVVVRPLHEVAFGCKAI